MRCETGCRRHAQVLWLHTEQDIEWALCGHHSDQHADALDAQGYALMVDQRVETLGAQVPA